MTAVLTLAKKRLRFAINLPNPCAKAGTMRMSVLPHRSGKTEPQAAAAPSQQRAKVIAASTLRIAERIAKLADETAKETKNVTANAVAASKVGLARAVELGRENVLPEIERASAKIKERTRGAKPEGDYPPYRLRLTGRVPNPAPDRR